MSTTTQSTSTTDKRADAATPASAITTLEQRKAELEAQLHHEVRALLADISAYEQWLPSATSLVPMAPGPTDAPDDAQGLTLQATDDDTRAQWQWSWEVHAGGAGADCRVTLTERGRVGNPVLRFVAALRGHGSHAERTLRALAEHCDEFDVAVEHVG
jgi:hypothetical protein